MRPGPSGPVPVVSSPWGLSAEFAVADGPGSGRTSQTAGGSGVFSRTA